MITYLFRTDTNTAHKHIHTHTHTPATIHVLFIPLEKLLISQLYHEGADTCTEAVNIRLNNFKFIYMSLVSYILVFQDNRKQLHRKEYSTAVFNMAAKHPHGLLVCFMQIQMQMGSACKYILYLKQCV